MIIHRKTSSFSKQWYAIFGILLTETVKVRKLLKYKSLNWQPPAAIRNNTDSIENVLVHYELLLLLLILGKSSGFLVR